MEPNTGGVNCPPEMLTFLYQLLREPRQQAKARKLKCLSRRK